MKTLVTGGGGFLGRYIVKKLLERGWEVAILGRSPQPDLEDQGVKLFQGDLEDVNLVEVACKGRDAVFHVAAKAGIWGDLKSFYQPNIVGTHNVISACQRHGVGRLVYTSTPSVVFNRQSFQNADETLPYGRNWLCHYAQTKSMAEKEVLFSHQSNGLRTTALRPHLIWGVGDPHLLPRVIERAKSGRLRIVGDGKNLVDITHVENAAEAHLLALDALEKGAAGGKAYFISQGEPVRLWEWINELLRGLSIPLGTKKISLKKAYAVGACLEGFYKTLNLKEEPPMTRFLALELAKDHYFNISAARRDLGYEPKVSTRQGMADFLQYFKSADRKLDSD